MSADGSGKVFTVDGRVLTLDRTMTSGGAGSIHRILEIPDLVGKIYHPGPGRGLYERKVEAMISLVPDLPDIDEGGVREVQITWPRFLLRDGQRRFVGFAMPLLDFKTSIELECVLQERQARAQGLPTGLGAKVTLAANLASLIAEVHRQGHAVIDLKPVNLRFYRRSLHIAMLDCDGFSIKGKGERFPAAQFTPEYLAPEFQLRGLSGGGDQAGSEEAQDRFALAVVIFQLLNFGIHPFTGRPASERVPSDVPGRIARHCYAYGVRPNPEMAPNPASGHSAMPTELRLLFDRAFGAVGMARPSADDWVGRLRAYGRRSTGLLVACRANAQHQHFAGLPCAACARASLLTRASSVVRAPAQAIPLRIALRPVPSTYPAGWPPTPVQLPPPPPAAWTQPGTPSWTPRPWMNSLWYLIAFVIVPFIIVLTTFCSPSHRRKSSFTRTTDRTHERRETSEPDTAEPAASLDSLLAAARSGGSKGAFVRQLGRLPGMQGSPDQERCQAAAESWRQTVQWTEAAPAFARTRQLSSYEPAEKPCDDFHFLGARIVRTLELCEQRLDSPGAYPGIGEAECAENQVIPSGVDVLRRALLYGPSSDPLVWEDLGEAFLLSGDPQDADGAFVIAAHFQRIAGFDENAPPLSELGEDWLRERQEILMARAWAQIHQWNQETVSDDLTAISHAYWPAQPPPKKPKHRRAQP